MISVRSCLKDIFTASVRRAFPVNVQPHIQESYNQQFDYVFTSTPDISNMMKLQKYYFGGVPKKEIAYEVCDQIEANDFIEKLNVNAEGEIEVSIKTSLMKNCLEAFLRHKKFENHPRAGIAFPAEFKLEEDFASNLRGIMISEYMASIQSQWGSSASNKIIPFNKATSATENSLKSYLMIDESEVKTRIERVRRKLSSQLKEKTLRVSRLEEIDLYNIAYLDIVVNAKPEMQSIHVVEHLSNVSILNEYLKIAKECRLFRDEMNVSAFPYNTLSMRPELLNDKTISVIAWIILGSSHINSKMIDAQELAKGQFDLNLIEKEHITISSCLPNIQKLVETSEGRYATKLILFYMDEIALNIFGMKNNAYVLMQIMKRAYDQLIKVKGKRDYDYSDIRYINGKLIESFLDEFNTAVSSIKTLKSIYPKLLRTF